MVEEEEESFLLCEACGTFYKEGEFHDCRLHESAELMSEREFIQQSKEKSEEEELREKMLPLTKKKKYRELLDSTVLELAREDLETTGKVLSEEQYEELAKKTLLKQALKEKYSEVPQKERMVYYRSLRDTYEQWKKKLWSGEYKDVTGQKALYVCPICGRASGNMDVTYQHFEREHPEQVRWLLRVSDLLEGKFDRYKEYYPKKSKEEKAIDILEGKREQLSKGEDKDKTYLRNLTILTALTRRKEEE